MPMVTLLRPASSPSVRSRISVRYPLSSAQRRYMRSSIAAQSCESVPPRLHGWPEERYRHRRPGEHGDECPPLQFGLQRARFLFQVRPRATRPPAAPIPGDRPGGSGCVCQAPTSPRSPDSSFIMLRAPLEVIPERRVLGLLSRVRLDGFVSCRSQRRSSSWSTDSCSRASRSTMSCMIPPRSGAWSLPCLQVRHANHAVRGRLRTEQNLSLHL